MTKISVGIIAAALSLAASSWVHAAGLGRLTVLSPLGHALNAEIEIVSLQPGEEESLTARAAPFEAFRQAGIEPHPALVDMRFAIARRNGRPVIHVTTSQPVSEPFLDLLVELQWDQGRLVREYTVLLDPPEYKGPQPIAAVPPKPTALEARPLPPVAAAPETQQSPRQQPLPDQASQPAEQPAARAPIEPAAVAAAPLAPAGDQRYAVNRGDTLGGIARQHRPQGVTLNQMLFALFRANQDAFIRGNINLVRAGRVLDIPSEEGIRAIDVQEANRLVQAHHGDFDAYRRRLAAAPALVDTAPRQQAVAGTIEPTPAAPAPAAPQDQLRLAQADPAGQPAAAAAQGDDAVASERAMKEAQSRIADLEKTVADLQKLLEVRNQQLSQMQAQASAQPVPSAPQPAPAAEVKPPEDTLTEAPKAEAAKVEAPLAEAPKSETAAAPAMAPEPKKAAPKPKPAAAKAKAAPPPPPTSMVDEVLENPLALGLGGVSLLVFGYGVYAWRRKKSSQTSLQEGLADEADMATFDTGSAEASAARDGAPEPVGGSAGIEGDEVDPVAEADVYMAYGRDAQAEDILKEALQKDPNRLAVHVKLLEIYAKRRDVQGLEQAALKVKSLTHGRGPDWERASALGRSIDATNGLYGGAAAAAAAIATPAVASAAPALDFDLGGATTPGTSTPDISLDEPVSESASSIDFDVGAASVGGENDKSDFTPEGTLIIEEPKSASTGFDFDLNLGDEAPKALRAAAPAAAQAGTGGGLDFDLNIDVGDEAPAAPATAVAPLDLSTITLDLGSAGEPGTAAPSNDPKWQEVATKLDLAKAYEEMGDKDGARELLNEVMQDGDTDQKGQAELLLARL
jgi:pilus assembly protein FimV